MKYRRAVKLNLILVGTVWLVTATSPAHAQTNLKKLRIGVSETHVGYLPLQVAFHKGYYKDEARMKASISKSS